MSPPCGLTHSCVSRDYAPKRMPADIPVGVIMPLHYMSRFVYTENRQTKRHSDQAGIHALSGEMVKQRSICCFFDLASGVEDERIVFRRAVEQPSVFRLCYCDGFIGP